MINFNCGFYIKVTGPETKSIFLQNSKCSKKNRRYFPHCYSDKDLKGAVVNCACHYVKN